MRKLNIFYLALTLALTLIFSPASAGQNLGKVKYLVSYSGFGPVKVGMTPSEASKELGIPLEREEEEGDCSYVAPKRSIKGVSFMVIGKRIARVDVFERGYATDRGAQVGDTEARIMRLYRGLVKVSEHPYVDGHYLRVDMKGGRRSILFETDGKRVTSFRAGNSREVSYIEGCS
jgi:hypothetical protein